jgi:hypothetical protein
LPNPPYFSTSGGRTMDDDGIRNRHKKDNGGDDNHIQMDHDNRYSSLENQSMEAFMSPAFIFIYTLDICKIEKNEHFLLLNGQNDMENFVL